MIVVVLAVVAFVSFVLGVEFGRSDTGRRLGYFRRAKTYAVIDGQIAEGYDPPSASLHDRV